MSSLFDPGRATDAGFVGEYETAFWIGRYHRWYQLGRRIWLGRIWLSKTMYSSVLLS